MNEFKSAVRTALHLLVIFVLSRFVDPLIARLIPVGSEVLQEAVSLVLTAFLFGLAGAFLWGEPRIAVQWEAFRSREPLYKIDLRVRETGDSGVLLKLVAKGHAEKPLARWLLRRAVQRGLKLEVAPKQAPVNFTVDTSACADDGKPLAIVQRGSRGVTLLLEGDPPLQGALGCGRRARLRRLSFCQVRSGKWTTGLCALRELALSSRRPWAFVRMSTS